MNEVVNRELPVFKVRSLLSLWYTNSAVKTFKNPTFNHQEQQDVLLSAVHTQTLHLTLKCNYNNTQNIN